MSTMSLRLPESLHERARELAKREGVSINQLIATALAEKVSALDTVRLSRGAGSARVAGCLREGASEGSVSRATAWRRVVGERV